MKKIKIPIIAALILLVLGGVVYFAFIKGSPSTDNVTKQGGAENVAQQAKDDVSDQGTASKASAEGTGNAERPKSNGQLEGVSLSAPSFSQSNGTIKASVNVTSSSSGTCYYGFSSADTKPVSRTNQSQAQSGKQICTVEIPEAEFTKLGTWKMLISFTQSGANVERSQDVTIN